MSEENMRRVCEFCKVRWTRSAQNRFCSQACNGKSRAKIGARGVELFWMLVDKAGPVPKNAAELGPCWIWTGGKGTLGYGATVAIDGLRDMPHRHSFRFVNGAIANTMRIAHKCGRPLCVNPQHLAGAPKNNYVRPLICEWCRCEFFHDRAVQRFCGKGCANKAKGNAQKSIRLYRTCPQCGTSFDTCRTPKRFCGPVCRDKGNVKPPVMRVCLECAKRFPVPNCKAKKRRFCSLPCANRHTNRMASENRPAITRFWTRVDKNGPVPEHVPELGPCWIFANGRPYGSLRGDEGAKSVLAHRFSYELANGPIPSGLLVCHKCDNGAGGCVRPDHLFVGTTLDNARDMVSKGRQAKGAGAGPRPGKRALGVKHGMAKLTEADVSEIRKLLASGLPGKDIANRFRVAQTNVSMIRNRKTWRHLA